MWPSFSMHKWYVQKLRQVDVSVSNDTYMLLVENLWPHVKPIIHYCSTSMKQFLRPLGVNDDELSPFCKDFISAAELWLGFDNFFSTANGNFSTSNNNMDGAPMDITNDGGDDVAIGGGVVNYVNVQTMTE